MLTLEVFDIHSLICIDKIRIHWIRRTMIHGGNHLKTNSQYAFTPEVSCMYRLVRDVGVGVGHGVTGYGGRCVLADCLYLHIDFIIVSLCVYRVPCRYVPYTIHSVSP